MTGLEGADGPAELLAHLGVFDGHLQRRPADADCLGRGEDPEHRPGLACGAAKHAILFDRHAAQRDRPDAAGGVQRVQRGDGDTVGRGVDDDDVLTGRDHQNIGVRRPQHGRALAGDNQVRTDRHAAGQGERANRAAIGQPRKQLRTNGIRRAAVDHHGGRHGREERPGGKLAALSFQYHHQLGESEARPAVFLGDRQTVPAEILARRPDLAGVSRPLLQGRAGRSTAVQPVQLPENGVGQVVVFLGDGES